MQETSALLENSAPAAVGGGSVSDGGSAEDETHKTEVGDRNYAGNYNRWPREETLALLKIRSDMDLAFRDSPVKAPLWDHVARKLAELGHHRSAKKCKEKFENTYKYHKRTKDGRSGRQNGKNYRFFEQLEGFDSQNSVPSLASSKIETFIGETTMAMPTTMIKPMIMANPIRVFQDVTVTTPRSIQNHSTSARMATSTSTTSSSGKESDGNAKKKRKLADYFDRLMKEVLEKQENMQNKFIEAIEKSEKHRIEREEAWKMQDMARIKKQQEISAHERAITATKDATVIAFLQKITEQAIPLQVPENPMPQNPSPSEKIIDKQENIFGENSFHLSSSRWPKAEVEALIKLKTNIDLQYQDNGPKGPLWDEISSAMKKLGYDRSGKRCKEKWENINKYFKRVKESNKKRGEDAKTCPYFHLLESLYERKSKKIDNSSGSNRNLNAENTLMQMTGQQQQQQQYIQQQSINGEREKVHKNNEEDEEDDYDDDNEDDYQIVANNPSSVTAME